MRTTKSFVYLVFVYCISISGCATLPQNVNKTVSYSKPSGTATPLTEYADNLVMRNPGKSGVSILRGGMQAFLARALLIKAAQDSLDLQYYIWKDDTTGKILNLLLIEAADRGVRVRLLLDDLNTQGLDPTLQALNQHNNIEIRLYNPFSSRNKRFLNLISDFSRLNHRMHNKLFITDSKMIIVGGRNIGDEYFQASPVVEFDDIDLLSLGPVVSQANTSFDHYWNSSIAYPLEAIITENTGSLSLETLKHQLQNFHQQQQDSDYATRLRESRLLDQILSQNITWYWDKADLLYDRAGKSKDTAAEYKILAQDLNRELQAIKHEFIIISPYFVPGDNLLEQLARLRKRDIEVYILTNSLSSTDVPLVHAGYQKYRKKLLRMGIHLYEMKATGKTVDHKKLIYFTSDTRNSLHAKSYIFDKNKLFIGSFNLDPRSVHINTELGLLVKNKQLATLFSDNLKPSLEDYAYRLELRKSQSELQHQDQIVWIDKNAGEGIIHYVEPGTGPFEVLFLQLLSLLPIEEQL